MKNIVIITLVLIVVFQYYTIKQTPKISLPEEYKATTKADTLRGYFQNDSLIIEFNNYKNK